jgi:phosphoglycerate mutase (EC 5.4.2.1)
LPLLCAALWLTGCASTRLVDSDVQSFSQLAGAPARATYAFERLPSQQAQGAQQSAVEEQARLALAKVGLRQDSAAPFYRVQAHARTDLLAYPDYWDGPGWGWGGWGGGRGFYGGLSMRFPPPTLYRREVGLILREAASRQRGVRNPRRARGCVDRQPGRVCRHVRRRPERLSHATHRATPHRPGNTALRRAPCPMNATRIIAIRHGETAWNVDTRIQGHLDIPLNDTGLWQARQLARALADEPVAAIYTSDLQRARATAQAVADTTGAPLTPEPDLRERSFGHFQGRTFAQIEAELPEDALRWRKRDPHYAPEGGESLTSLRSASTAPCTAWQRATPASWWCWWRMAACST